jgi:cytochrome c oxidase assembly factor CtaG
LLTDWDIPIGISCVLAAVAIVYVRGWLALRRSRPATLPAWRLVAFFSGLIALFIAVSSSLDTFSEVLLVMHMAQHFVLMSVAPPLIVLGAPFVPMLRGLPRWLIRKAGGPIFRSRVIHHLRRFLPCLSVAWLAMNLTYIGWHIPKAYEFALSSEGWHNFEHACFFVTSLLFWWLVFQPWPMRRTFDQWMIIPYLLTSDLVNTGLSAFLCFSGRLLYPTYDIENRPFGIDALSDQVAAGSFMWVCGSVVFVVPAIYLAVSILTSHRSMMKPPEIERYRALVP